MPAVRAVHLEHPLSGVPGLWLELSTSAPGVLTGLARTAFPSVGGQSLAEYTTTLNTTFRSLCSLPGRVRRGNEQPDVGWFIDGANLIPKIVEVTITLSSTNPVTISNVTVGEGAVRERKVTFG